MTKKARTIVLRNSPFNYECKTFLLPFSSIKRETLPRSDFVSSPARRNARLADRGDGARLAVLASGIFASGIFERGLVISGIVTGELAASVRASRSRSVFKLTTQSKHDQNPETET